MESIDIKNRHVEKQVFIDSDIMKFDNKIKIEFNKDIDIYQMYFKEMILNHTKTKIDLNMTRFLVIRLPDLKKHSNNVVYNTSVFDPDTDVIMYRTCCYPENLHFEAKMMFSLEYPLHTRDLRIEVMDDQANLLTNKELGNFFIDLKLVIGNYLFK